MNDPAEDVINTSSLAFSGFESNNIQRLKTTAKYLKMKDIGSASNLLAACDSKSEIRNGYETTAIVL